MDVKQKIKNMIEDGNSREDIIKFVKNECQNEHLTDETLGWLCEIYLDMSPDDEFCKEIQISELADNIHPDFIVRNGNTWARINHTGYLGRRYDIEHGIENGHNVSVKFISPKDESNENSQSAVSEVQNIEEDFFNNVYIEDQDCITLKKLLCNKKNLIIQGPPGVGKTFIAKRLAYSLIGFEIEDRIMMVQFHQSYSYEDFVEGYRPVDNGFELKKGSFYNFCKKVIEDPEKDYFFIIDEINRGNLSKIFGELFMLIENDKRGEKVQLLYSNEEFYIPENLYIIGLMNTADRSIAMIDYALRRRFAFFDLKPGFSSAGFMRYQKEVNNSSFNELIDVMKDLNNAIEDDETLGEGFRIGHSFFCNLNDAEVEKKLNYIVEYEMIPLLKEYWFDEPDKVADWSEKLRNSLKE